MYANFFKSKILQQLKPQTKSLDLDTALGLTELFFFF